MTHSPGMSDVGRPGSDRAASHPWRGPLALLGVTAVLYGVATVLDRGDERSRDLALLVGVPALYVLLPAGLLWLLGVAAVRWRRGRGRTGTGRR